MKFIHPKTSNDVNEVNKHIENGNKIFMLLFLDGCGPCNATRPEWDKIPQHTNNMEDSDDIVVVDMEHTLIPHLKYVGDVDGFPSLKYIDNNGKNVENYEDNTDGDRTVEGFVKWIGDKNASKKFGGGKTKQKQTSTKKKSSRVRGISLATRKRLRRMSKRDRKKFFKTHKKNKNKNKKNTKK